MRHYKQKGSLSSTNNFTGNSRNELENLQKKIRNESFNRHVHSLNIRDQQEKQDLDSKCHEKPVVYEESLVRLSN